MSPTPDSALADPQQTIDDLQRELAERTAERDEASRRLDKRTAERDEALEQQTATAEVLQVINSSPGELAPVFDAMLEKAMQLCEAEFGILNTYDGETFHRAAARGVPSAFEEWRLRQGPMPSGPGTLYGRITSGEKNVLHTLDLMAEDSYRDGDPDRRAFVELAGARTALVVALRKEETLLGTITIFRQEVRPFSDKQIALLQNFAAQAVIAMENARLITETREALDQQTATAEVLGVINSSPGDLAPVFDAILEKAHGLCGADSGGLVLVEGNRYRAVAVHGEPSFAEYWLDLGWIPYPTGEDTLFGRLSRGEVVHLRDAAIDDGTRKSDQYHRLVELAGARSLVMVPLRKDDVLFGTITGFRNQVQPFSDKQIALLQNFAAQAVIAMENARLITETREALEQQTATAEVLGVINSSPGDLAPVFDAILEKAHSLCGATFGGLLIYDGDRFKAVALHNVPPAFAEIARSFLATPHHPIARLLGGEPLVHIADLKEIAEVAPTGSLPRAGVDLAGIRTLLLVPLRKGDALLGVITAYRQEVCPFSDKQIALLQNFAVQAVIAIENARLITETREALEQQTATAEVLQVINSSPGELAPVFDAMLEKALRLCGAAFGDLVTFDGERCTSVARHGFPPALVEFFREPFEPGPESYVGRLLLGEGILHVTDLAAELPSRSAPLRRAGIERGRALVELGNARTGLFMPLRKDDALLGALRIYRQEIRPFTDKQIALLQNFAAQAVIAMENARLITETREALEQQTATAEVLQVINASPGDLAPVFDAILEKAHNLCGATLGSLRLYDGKYVRAVAVRGHEGDYADELRRGVALSDRVVTSLLQGAPFLQFPDMAESDDPGPRASFERSGGRTALIVPLRKDSALLGMIFAARQEVQPFTDKQIALLQNFAAQAVIAMENARLLGELRQRTEEVGELNRDLEARVAEQVDELGRVGRLKRFLAPQLAELIVSHGEEKILESHRREIVVVFCDLRGYTAFTETAEPEEVLDFLRQYHGALGPLVSQFEGTLDQFSGDGIMVFFNDPVPCADPAERAVNMAVAMRSAANTLIADWRERGRDLGFGAGIAQGYATLGQIGFSERSGYTAIGTVCNVAARLCAEAKDGQILLGQLVNVALKGSVATEQLGPLALKGLSQPVVAYNVPLGAIQPALRVIEGGPQSV